MTLNFPGKPYLALSSIIWNPVESVIWYYPESGGIWYLGISGIRNPVKKWIRYIPNFERDSNYVQAVIEQ